MHNLMITRNRLPMLTVPRPDAFDIRYAQANGADLSLGPAGGGLRADMRVFENSYRPSAALRNAGTIFSECTVLQRCHRLGVAFPTDLGHRFDFAEL